MYKEKASDWVRLPKIEPMAQKVIAISDLKPSTSYDLKITAFNEAGPTEAQYSFMTSSKLKGNAFQTIFSARGH